MRKILVFLIIFLSIPICVQAVDETKSIEKENRQVEQLYNYISNMKTNDEILQGMDAKTYVKNFMKTGDGKFSLNKIAAGIVEYSIREITASMRLVGILVLISIICALIHNLQKAFNNDSISNIAYFACYGLIILVAAKSFTVSLEVAKEAISKMSDFMAALMPVLMMLLASVGGFSEATIMDPIIMGAINLTSTIFVNFIIPAIFMVFVLQFVNNLSEDFKVDKLTKLIRQLAIWTQGVIMTVFIGIVSIRGITSKTIDQVTAKTAKYAVDNFIPVIGKCLSDAISTVAGYSILLKNALSSFGLIMIVIIVLFPVIKIFIMAMLYKLTAALIEPISDSRLVNSITAAGDSLLLIMSSMICISIMFFIMLSIIASAGKMAIGG